jgi:dihydrodipicolinate synthase/N-acetylneuraminate lyase
MASSRREKLVGVVVSLPTFNDDNFNLLLKKEKRHIEWLIEHGLTEGNGVLMIAGGLGEGYFLDDDEWRAMADCVVDATQGRVPTCIGVFELSARKAAKKAVYAADAGIDFLQFAPPHYMVPSEEDVFGHFKYVNDAADIGIMAYNIPWAMPNPGFEYRESILERFTTLENVVGIKWSSFDAQHYVRMLRRFGGRFNFIDNGGLLGLGPRLGMKGFIDFQANLAPSYSLKKWALIKEEKFEELDNLELDKLDSFIRVVHPEEQSWSGMGEGPTSRLRLSALGMDAGPFFPAQAPLSEAYVRGYMRAVEASGIREHVEWDESVFDGLEAEEPIEAGALAD